MVVLRVMGRNQDSEYIKVVEPRKLADGIAYEIWEKEESKMISSFWPT